MKQPDEKTILVTGANGFIGSHLVQRLSEMVGVKLLLLSRQDQKSTQQNVVWLKGELSQLTQKYWQSLGVKNIDLVFHLGGFAPKSYTESNLMDRVIEDNISGTRGLLQGLPGNQVKLVFASTVDVYAQPENGEVISEGSKIAPNTLFGASKFFCESMVSAWAKASGNTFAIMRYGHIYGPGEGQYKKLIPATIRNLHANQAPTIYGDGSTLRDYLYVGDAVEATIRASLIVGNVEPLNIVRGESVSLRQITQLLISLTKSNLQTVFLQDKQNGCSLRFDSSLMTTVLGDWIMTPLEHGLAAEINEFAITDQSD